jgi:hypothetical protein
MKRKLYVAKAAEPDRIVICESNGNKIVCTLPHDEQRLARFIVRCVNLFGFGLRPYDKTDWWMERGVKLS